MPEGAAESPAAPLLHWPLDGGLLNSTYETLNLVSHPRHLAGLDAGDGSALVVATEWWVFQIARERGFAAVHVDAFTRDCPQESGACLDVYLEACNWVFGEGGRDMTLYNGVSLGRLCGTFLALTRQSAAGLHVAIERLCRLMSVRRLVLFDLSAQFFSLSDDSKRCLVLDIAERHGCQVVDRLDAPLPGEAAMHLRTFVGPRPPAVTGCKDRLRNVFAWAVESAFRLGMAMRGHQRRVFLNVSNLSLGPMVESFDGRRIVPVIAAAQSPKSWAFLSRCWKNGILPAATPRPGGGASRRAACQRIVAEVEAWWSSRPVHGADAVFRQAVRDFLFAPGVLEGLAEMVDGMANFLDRLAIKQVVVADATGPTGRALCELAHARGIWTDESTNGVFVSAVKDPTRCGHGSMPATLNRQLAFGPAGLRWMDELDSPACRVITGYPGLGHPQPGPVAKPLRLRNALVLPVYAWTNDPTVPRGVITPLMVAMVRELAQQGFTGIRIKTHPGVDNLAFYRQLAVHFGLDCEVPDSGSFAEHLAWADIVVGPVGTSCFLEALAAGKPYFVLRPEPTSIPDHQLPGAVVGATAEELAAKIAAGQLPDRDLLLNHWIALDQVTDPVAATWAAIKQGDGA